MAIVALFFAMVEVLGLSYGKDYTQLDEGLLAASFWFNGNEIFDSICQKAEQYGLAFKVDSKTLEIDEYTFYMTGEWFTSPRIKVIVSKMDSRPKNEIEIPYVDPSKIEDLVGKTRRESASFECKTRSRRRLTANGGKMLVSGRTYDRRGHRFGRCAEFRAPGKRSWENDTDINDDLGLNDEIAVPLTARQRGIIEMAKFDAGMGYLGEQWIVCSSCVCNQWSFTCDENGCTTHHFPACEAPFMTMDEIRDKKARIEAFCTH